MSTASLQKIPISHFFRKHPTPKAQFFTDDATAPSESSVAKRMRHSEKSPPIEQSDSVSPKGRVTPPLKTESDAKKPSLFQFFKTNRPVGAAASDDTDMEPPKFNRSRSPTPSAPSPTTAPSSRAKLSEPVRVSKSVQESLLASVKGFSLTKGVTWKKGEPVPYSALASAFDEVEANPGRNKIIEIMRDLYRKIIALTPQDLLPCIYLSVGQIAPSYEGVELGVADASLTPLVSELTGLDAASIKGLLKTYGDLGKLAQAKTSKPKSSSAENLTIAGVFEELQLIAADQGTSAIQKKQDRLRKLLAAARNSELQFLIRTINGKLRIGLAESSVLAALAHAIVLTPNSDEIDISLSTPGPKLAGMLEGSASVLKQVYSEVPNYDRIVADLLHGGIPYLRDHCFFSPGIPVKSMLAKPTKGVREVFDRFASIPFTCEYKYDGERTQIHMTPNGKVSIYSRNSENLTQKYPDVAALIPKVVNPGTKSFVIDAEVVAINKDTNKLMPFQVLSTRARKGVTIESIKVSVCIFAFDCILLNGKTLLQESFRQRRQALHQAFSGKQHKFEFARSKDSSDVDEIESFLQDAVQSGCEGLMVKTLDADSTYEPSKRSNKWLKLKKDYLEGMGDTLDLVPIGAYHGMGKRSGVYGAFLLACYDEENETFQTICKIGTGFSDDKLSEFHSELQADIIRGPLASYQFSKSTGLTPDVWFEPKHVWEVLAADLSISPHHKAAIGLVDPQKGIALRFPRFVRVRPDKNPEDATKNSQVVELYQRQASVSHSTPDDDDGN